MIDGSTELTILVGHHEAPETEYARCVDRADFFTKVSTIDQCSSSLSDNASQFYIIQLSYKTNNDRYSKWRYNPHSKADV